MKIISIVHVRRSMEGENHPGRPLKNLIQHYDPLIVFKRIHQMLTE